MGRSCLPLDLRSRRPPVQAAPETYLLNLLGISRQGVDYLAKNDPTFPAPLAVLSIGRVWERRDVEKWARETLWRPMANTDALPQLLTIDQLAERLGVSIRHIRRLIAERRVPYLKVGWFIRFDPAEIAT